MHVLFKHWNHLQSKKSVELRGRRPDVNCITTIRKGATNAYSEPPKTYQILWVLSCFIPPCIYLSIYLFIHRYAAATSIIGLSMHKSCPRLSFHRQKSHSALYGKVYMGTLLLETQMFPGVYRCVPGPEGQVAMKCLDLVCCFPVSDRSLSLQDS